MTKTRDTVLVLGIGNLLWADEGFGVRAVEELNRRFEFPDHVRLLDGGTQGIYLVQHIREARILVVFDAVDYGLAPGTLKRVLGDDVPRFLGLRKVSLHQTGFQEVLAMAEMMGDKPEHMLLVGVQPQQLEDFGGSLTPVVKEALEPALELALAYLAEFGITAHARPNALDDNGTLASIEMALAAYEQGRPPDIAAPRNGDERVLSSPHWRGPDDYDAEIQRVLETPPASAAGGR